MVSFSQWEEKKGRKRGEKEEKEGKREEIEEKREKKEKKGEKEEKKGYGKKKMILPFEKASQNRAWKGFHNRWNNIHPCI